jgi:hypothetical protein
MKQLMVATTAVTVVALLTLGMTGCGDQPGTEESASTALADRIAAEGFTCGNVQEMIAPGEDLRELRDALATRLGEDGLLQLIEARSACHGEAGEVSGSAAVTGSYVVEWVEEASGTGGVTGLVFRDSSSSGWMCNGGRPESPADYLVQYNVSSAYANRSRLRVRGTNWWASCYIQSSNAARVYTDNDVRMCVGFWSVFFCGAVAPTSGDTRMWLQ